MKWCFIALDLKKALVNSVVSIACLHSIFIDYILNFLRSNSKNGFQQKKKKSVSKPSIYNILINNVTVKWFKCPLLYLELLKKIPFLET